MNSQECPPAPKKIDGVMTQKEFDTLSKFLVHVADARRQSVFLNMMNREKYGAMAYYVENLHKDILMHHDVNKPFFDGSLIGVDNDG